MTELLLKIFDVKVIVKDWLPSLYYKKYTTSLKVIVSSLTKSLHQGKKYGDSFSIEKDSREENEHLANALSSFELENDWRFELQSLFISLKSFSQPIIALNVKQ